MKVFIAVAAVLLSFSAAHAAPNNTPHAIACMKKNGFTRDMWVAHRAGTDQQVLRYLQCRDGVSQAKALETGRRDGNFSRGF